MPYRLLTEFERLFSGQPYFHRDSSRGDFLAMHLYEDLVSLGRSASPKLIARIEAHDRVLSTANTRVGIRARRGDGTLGEPVPSAKIITDPGYAVARGPVATIEIGVEVKILAKALIKQIDRVIGDLQKQVAQFRHRGGHPITIGIVGINHAPYSVGYEGTREFRTDGKANRHPIQEAAEAERRLLAHVPPFYDSFIILNYAATNESPFPFSWVSHTTTDRTYAAELVRISRLYDQRF